MDRAYFKNIGKQIIPLLDNAKRKVIVAMAWFTSEGLFQALLSCVKRGVQVELVLLDNDVNFMYYAPDFNLFIKAGGILRIARVNRGFMHHKFCVIDESIVVTGSYNWTFSAENRNIENIIVTDNKAVISLYSEEFNALTNLFSEVSESPRINWDEIGLYNNVSYEDLNYEIAEIAKYKNLPARKVVKPTTVVTIDEKPLNPISKYDIGLKATDKGCNDSMTIIIPKGAKLPYSSKTIDFYNYNDHRSKVLCTVLYSVDNFKKFIAEKNITEITSGRNDYELTIRVQFTLIQSGDLFAEIRCVETGKVISVKTSNQDLVDYAE